MHTLCRRLLGDDADALDATQDALLAAVKALGRFDGRSAFTTWLYRIATNTCIDELRRRRRRPATSLEALGGDDLWYAPPGAGLWDGSAGATRRAGAGDADGRDPGELAALRTDLDAALRALPAEFRTAVVLRDVCDLPYEEIAAILEVPAGTVRSRIARGRAALAARWGMPGNHEGPPHVQPKVTGKPDAAASDREGSPT